MKFSTKKLYPLKAEIDILINSHDTNTDEEAENIFSFLKNVKIRQEELNPNSETIFNIWNKNGNMETPKSDAELRQFIANNLAEFLKW